MTGLMNIKETAKFLNMGVTRLYEMANNGRIPCLKIGGKWKFDPTALKKWWEGESLIQERANKGK